MGVGMAVGSQRAGLVGDDLAKTFRVARKTAPSIFLAANIGGAQLAKGFSIKDAKKLIDMIEANALIVHLNPLQELIQPEGETNFKGVLEKISDLVAKVNVPIIVKEVGAGISKEVAIRLEMAGVAVINVAGVGGTSWAGVEQIRAKRASVQEKTELGNLFWDWGMPTAVSLMEVKRAVKIPIIASGGLRNGLDIAKCISLDANVCAMAHPMLKAAAISKSTLISFIEKTVRELKSTMYLVGATDIPRLASTRKIITSPLAEWLQ